MKNGSRPLQSALLLAIGCVALVFMVGMTFWLGERAQFYFNDTIQARDTRGGAVELRHALQTAESSQRGYLVTGNQIYLAPYSTAKTQTYHQLGAVEWWLAGSAEIQPALQRLRAVVDDKFAEMDQTIELKRQRRDAEALAIFRSNRGKALMDEANVFLSSIIRKADERLTAGVDEQRENATLLRLVSILGGALIVVVVGVVIWIIVRYARDLARANQEVSLLNQGLEQRVADRTAELTRARDRAEVLLAEVNHRVANSLSLVGSMVGLQAKAATSQPARDVLEETQSRIQAVSLVHQRLYTSGDVRSVALDEYLAALLAHLETSMRDAGHRALLRHELEPLKLPTDKSINLGVVAAEWVTNAFKYAYPDHSGEIRVTLRRLSDGPVELVVEDDGVGRGDSVAPRGTGLGTKLVNAMAMTMGAEIRYSERRPGTSARLLLPLQAA